MSSKDELKLIKKQKLSELFSARPVSVIVGIAIIILLSIAHLYLFFQYHHHIMDLSTGSFALHMLESTAVIVVYLAVMGTALLRGSSIALFITYTLPLWLFYIGTFLIIIGMYFAPQDLKTGLVAILFAMVYVAFAKLCFFYKGSQKWFRDCRKVRKMKIADQPN